MAEVLRVETHCHNVFSNHNNYLSRLPFDCGVTLEEQLEYAALQKIDVMFVTNHNTLDGYSQILEYKRNHEKYQNITIYPAEEITINNKGHVLAYGIENEIRPGMTLDETLDEIIKQNGISCAAHPFAVSNGIREEARKCDIIESFNSNNVDIFSNLIAERFTKQNNLKSIVGSDSHVKSTIGRSFNTVESENNIDSILESLGKGRFKIGKFSYASKEEMHEHAHYIISSSRQTILNSIGETNPKFHSVVKWAIDSFISNPNSKLWHAMSSLAMYLSKRVSKKVNVYGYNPVILQERSWSNLISLSLIP
ncbi:MAG TPA: PHP-associated domain-containing protein [Nitrososphaeraceae archaeon]|nr:PHP-associated domain-containing protein [Nitrososphaeraceae archaeon]